MHIAAGSWVAIEDRLAAIGTNLTTVLASAAVAEDNLDKGQAQ